jgi:hypothetical protein
MNRSMLFGVETELRAKWQHQQFDAPTFLMTLAFATDLATGHSRG